MFFVSHIIWRPPNRLARDRSTNQGCGGVAEACGGDGGGGARVRGGRSAVRGRRSGGCCHGFRVRRRGREGAVGSLRKGAGQGQWGQARVMRGANTFGTVFRCVVWYECCLSCVLASSVVGDFPGTPLLWQTNLSRTPQWTLLSRSGRHPNRLVVLSELKLCSRQYTGHAWPFSFRCLTMNARADFSFSPAGRCLLSVSTALLRRARVGGVPSCDIIVGPGNNWVTAAKSIVSGR